jgi:hypothetical protein
MDDKTLQALTALAQKLGTTAEHLWGVLLRQVPITAATQIALFLLAFAACCLWHRTVRRRTTVDLKTGTAEWGGIKDEDPGPFIAWISVGVAWVVLFFVGVEHASGWAAAFLNPEYLALKEVLRQIMYIGQ